jgi:galactose mutarotase-like enzyme
MFTITHHPDRSYQLISSNGDAKLTVFPDRGGIITEWSIKGTDILYLDQDRWQNPELSVRGGIPILFPICGNLPDNTYQINDRIYELKQHGFARDLPWEVRSAIADDHQASITLSLHSNPQTLAKYPFDFQLEFTYLWTGNQLRIHQRITNRSQEIMPASWGFHPYFNVTNKHHLQFDLPAQSYQNQQSQQVTAFNGDFPWEQGELDLIFRQLDTNQARITDSDRHTELIISWDDKYYRDLVFWTLPNQDFYCVEPWTAPRNALNTGDNLQHIPAQSTVSTWISMVINQLD